MKSFVIGPLLIAAVAVLVSSQPLHAQSPLGTTLTYQGRLDEGGGTASGSFPMGFRLWDAESGGNQVGPTLLFDGMGNNPPPVSVDNGLFSVTLDFGPGAFGSSARWLEITVGGIPLSPRQMATPAPAALFSSAPWAVNDSSVSYVNGAVGIGTTQPNTALEVARANGDTEIGIIGGDNGRRWTLQSSGGNADPDLAGSFQIIDRTLDASRFIINSDGFVGIGTSFPDRTMTVIGDTGLFGPVSINPQLRVSGNTFLDGNVGVNVFPFSAQANLHVVGDVQLDAGVVRFGAANENSDPISIRRRNGGSDYSSLVINFGDNPGAPVPPGDDIIFEAGGQAQFIFRSNGDAGKTGPPGWGSLSDEREKHHIQPLTGVLDQLLQLKGHSFFYNEPNKIGTRPGKCLGFIAQEVEPLFPEWVSTNRDGMKMLHTTGFEALAVEAMRELRAEKEAEIEAVRAEHESQIRALQSANESLQSRLDAMEALLTDLVRQGR